MKTNWPLWQIVLPIGVSFFTFIQINYLIEVRHRRQAIPKPLNYALFVTFFPHLIAGPMLKYDELEQLFDRRHKSRLSEDLAIGAAIIALGLFKKVVIGDTMGNSPTPRSLGRGRERSSPWWKHGVLCFASPSKSIATFPDTQTW